MLHLNTQKDACNTAKQVETEVSSPLLLIALHSETKDTYKRMWFKLPNSSACVCVLNM